MPCGRGGCPMATALDRWGGPASRGTPASMNTPLLRVSREALDQTAPAAHPTCWMCNSSNPAGLHLAFRVCGENAVEADFAAGETLNGYPNVLHGGMVASLLDAAMTNCLFAHGQVAVTAELNVRYRHPVLIQCPLRVRARLDRSFHSLFHVRAELIQEGVVKAFATAKFMGAVAAALPRPSVHG